MLLTKWYLAQYMSHVLSLGKYFIQMIKIPQVCFYKFHICCLITCQLKHTVDCELKRVIQVISNSDLISMFQKAQCGVASNETCTFFKGKKKHFQYVSTIEANIHTILLVKNKTSTHEHSLFNKEKKRCHQMNDSSSDTSQSAPYVHFHKATTKDPLGLQSHGNTTYQHLQWRRYFPSLSITFFVFLAFGYAFRKKKVTKANKQSYNSRRMETSSTASNFPTIKKISQISCTAYIEINISRKKHSIVFYPPYTIFK